MLVISMLLWMKKQIPSMGLTTYLSLTFCYIAIRILISPDMNHVTFAPEHVNVYVDDWRREGEAA